MKRPDQLQLTPNQKLYLAVESGDEAAVRQSIREGADVNAAYQSPFKPDSKSNDVESHPIACRTFEKNLYSFRRIRTSETSRVGKMPLHAATEKGHKGIVECLLAQGADVDASHHGWTPLHRAVLDENKILVELLLANGASVSAQNNADETALHFATMLQNTEIMKILILNKAPLDIQNKKGETPLNIAKAQNNGLEESMQTWRANPSLCSQTRSCVLF